MHGSRTQILYCDGHLFTKIKRINLKQKNKLQNPEESQDLDDEFLTREKQANVLHLRRQASFTFLFLARSRSVWLSLSPARALSPALSLSLGALSCSLVLSADLRFSAEHPRSYQLPGRVTYHPLSA
jgi:prepilin-type processing-associated H-X9-DG protein